MRMTTDDMGRILCLSGLAVSPDEKWIALTESRSDPDSGEWRSRVVLISREDGSERTVGSPDGAEQPAFSDDGAFLYYLDGPEGEKQLCMSPVGDPSAAPARLTSLRHGITAFAVGRDSLVFEAPLWPEEIRTGTALRAMDGAERAEYDWQTEYGPREITEIDYKRDECKGVRDGSVQTLGVLELSDGSVRLIACPHPLTMPALSPDGGTAACYGQPHTGARFSKRELFTVSLADGKVTCLTEQGPVSGDAPPAFTANGERIVFPGWFYNENGSAETLYALPVSGGKAVSILDVERDDLSSGVYGLPVCRTQYGRERPFFSVDTDGADFLGVWKGAERLFRVGLAEKSLPRELNGGEYSIHEFVRLGGGGFAALCGDDHTFRDLYEIRADGTRVRLRDSNPWLSGIDQGRALHRLVPSADGTVIHSTVTLPVGFEEGAKYPAVLYLHGGPTVSYTRDLWHEVQILAGAGYAVVTCDPRGSSGYGLAFAKDDYSWGEEACADLKACLDDAVSLGFIDPERVGVTGGSYGGYMTCKLIMRTQRFRAAVGQRVFVNQATSYGTGDIGFYSARRKPEEVVIRDCLMDRARRSLIRDMDRIRTPLLLLHGYQDYRCSFEQSEQMFISMHERLPEVPVRLCMFPGENHDVSRSGLLSHRQRHVQEMIDWFDRFLKEAVQ